MSASSGAARLTERVVPFRAGDGFSCNLVNLRGERAPTKGAVILVHGAGVRANLFRAPVRTTIVDYLHVLPEYGHLDVFWGTRAVRDTFPLILAELDKRH